MGLCPRCLIREGRDEDGPTPALEGEGEQIGPYKLLQKIGEGGFGAVFMAEQSQPVKRRVALKIIKAGMDTRQVIARFEAERQALAMMEHPNIARVLDAGATGTGRPYFAMELVRGVPITSFCDEHSLDNGQRLELFQDVCAAVGHAHQKGIIHRDLKPSNILVGLDGDTPVVKVIDFGVAKATQLQLTDKTVFTRFEQFIGTPLYISPEQASLSPIDIDTRSDIYSLGVLLYELLTGKPPLDQETLKKAGFDEMRRLIREQEAPKPSTRLSTATGDELRTIAKARHTEPRKLGSFIRGDLDWIVLKALEKDRKRRYETTNALRQDIARFLKDEVVTATPPSAAYRFRKFARRRRGPLAAAAAVLLAIVAGAVVSVQQGIRATREAQRSREALSETEAARRSSETARGLAEDSLYRMEILRAHQDLEDDRVAVVREMLERHLPRPGGEDRRGWEWYYLKSRLQQDEFTLEAGQGGLRGIDWSPDGTRFASAGEDGTVVVWNAESREVEQTFGTRGAGPVTALAWSPVDRDRLAAAMADHSVVLWDLATGSAKWRQTEHSDEVTALAWLPDGEVLASGGLDKKVVLSDAASGALLMSQRDEFAVHGLAWHPEIDLVKGAGLVPDDSSGVLAACFDDRSSSRSVALMSWSSDDDAQSAGSLKFLKRLGTPAGWSESIDWSARGRFLAGFAETMVMVWDDPLESSRELVHVEGGDRAGLVRQRERAVTAAHRGDYGVVAWHPSMSLLATASDDQVIKIWESDLSAPDGRFIGHDARVTGLAWHPTDETLLTCSEDGTIKGWSPSRGQKAPVLFQAPDRIRQAAWNPGGSEVAVAFGGLTVSLVDLHTGELKRSLMHQGAVPWVEWTPDGNRIATAGLESKVKVWDAATGDVLAVLTHEEPLDQVVWSPDGSQLASRSAWLNDQFGGDRLKVTVWNLAEDSRAKSRFVIRDSREGDESYRAITAISWCPDGERIVTGGLDGSVAVRDRHDGTVIQSLPGVLPGAVMSLAWDPEGGRMVAAGSKGRLAGLPYEDGRLGEPYFSKTVFTCEFKKVVWSPDGSRLAGCGADGTIKILDPHSGGRLLELRNPDIEGRQDKVTTIAWSPDGRALVAGGADGLLRAWDAGRGYQGGRNPGTPALVPVLIPKGGGSGVIGYFTTPAGRRLWMNSGPVGPIAAGDPAVESGQVVPAASEPNLDGPDVAALPPARKTHHYTFDDGTFTDLVGNLDGEVVGAGSISDGSLVLNGGTGELDATALAINTYKDLSIEVWATSDRVANTGFHVLVGLGEINRRDATLAANYVLLTPDRGDGMIRGAISTKDRPEEPLFSEERPSTPWSFESGVSSPRIDDGEEHHYVITVSESARRVELFVDGKSVGKRKTLQKLSDVATKIARLGLLYPQDPPWQGSINELAIYEGALTAAEVAEAYAKRPAPAAGVSADQSQELVERRLRAGRLRMDAEALVNRRMWKGSRQKLEALFADSPGLTDSLDEFRLAVVLAKLGDKVAHGAHCRRVLERHADTDDSTTIERIGRAYLYYPSDPALLDPVVGLVRRATGQGLEHEYDSWIASCRGMAEYRAGEWQRALDWFAKTDGVQMPNTARASAQAFRAMAAEKLGRRDEAKRYFEEARDTWWNTSPAAFMGEFNHVAAELAVDEAGALIGSD